MKVAITGHTSGIGKSIYEMFPDSIGFSRSNGYDISLKDSRTRIVEQISDCDVFFNNAHSGFSQTELLYDVWNSWKYKNKKIVSIGSRVSDYIYTKYPYPDYAISKSALDAASSNMAFQDLPCRVTIIKPGYVDTPGVSNKVVKKMCPIELAEFIRFIIISPESFWIPTITLYPG